MDYYARKEVSNSDLTWLKNELNPRECPPDPTAAFRFGNLIDAMITETSVVNFFERTVMTSRGLEKFSQEEFNLAENMKTAFLRDSFCRDLVSSCEGQTIMIEHGKQFEYGGLKFELDVRCKWDLWQEAWRWGGDVKSTTAETQKQFEAACFHFDYDRQRYGYMSLGNSDRDVIIGISKKNLKVFKVFIKKDDAFYNSGKEKYLFLAYKWYILLGKDKTKFYEQYEKR